MGAPAADGTRGEIVRLAHVGRGLHAFARRAASTLARAVPFDGAAIVACDPATAIPIGKWVENSITGDAGIRLMELELHEPDVNTMSELTTSGRLAASLSAATGGDLGRSLRYRELLRPHGLGDELRVVCMHGSHAWGVLVLHREHGREHFSAREVRLLAGLSGAFAEAFQRVSLRDGLSCDAPGPRDSEPGVLLLDDEDRVDMANPAAEAWLDELREEGRELPIVVSAVAHGARAVASGKSEVMATARVRAASGRWGLVRRSVLAGGAVARTAVTLESATVPELAPLIVQAYGLTNRERLVTERVAQGLSTAAIGRRLHLSPFTVQDHLKAVFDKVGVSNRGELVSKLFVDHYQAGIALDLAE